MKPASPLIVPLDVDSLEAAEALVRRLKGLVGLFKIGHQLFTRFGPESVALVHRHDEAVFLDLKFHDIPNTVAGAVASATQLGVRMLNVHASGGPAMMQAAVESAARQARILGRERPIVLGVTVLTSLSEDEMRQTWGTTRRLQDQVIFLAEQAQQAGLDGVVASPQETALLRQVCGKDFLIVTPGVRPAGAKTQDQKRVMTPAEAIAAGADYLVIGRPIYQAPDPRAAAEQILKEIAYERNQGADP